MKTLHLNLKRKWFDMILSGEKKEEYRDIKLHWVKRIVDKDLFKTTEDFLNWYGFPPKYLTLDHVKNSFDTITFSNGYAKDRDQFEIEYKGLRVFAGKLKWGAKKGERYFVLELGNILTTH